MTKTQIEAAIKAAQKRAAEINQEIETAHQEHQQAQQARANEIAELNNQFQQLQGRLAQLQESARARSPRTAKAKK